MMFGKPDPVGNGSLSNVTEITASNGLVWYAGQREMEVRENIKRVRKVCWYFSHDNAPHWWSVREYEEMLEIIDQESAKLA
jgi:hypothetical protein